MIDLKLEEKNNMNKDNQHLDKLQKDIAILNKLLAEKLKESREIIYGYQRYRATK